MNEEDTSRIDAFRAELTTLINRHSLENGSNTNDYVLADYLADCLVAFDRANTRRQYLAQLKTASATADSMLNAGPATGGR